jgi:predicted amidophosphoribosyltransferase
MSLKQLYPRFRNWQRQPLSYKEISSELRCCCNCGSEMENDYCPRCGQNAGGEE